MTDLETYLIPYPDNVRNLMLKGRQQLLEKLSPIVEMHYDATSAVCAGFITTGDLKGLFVNFAAYPKHVTLVFNFGVHLQDPEGRLNGEGKQIRHLRLKGIEDLSDPYLIDLILQSRANAPIPDQPLEHRIVTKVYAGPKRRPQNQ